MSGNLSVSVNGVFDIGLLLGSVNPISNDSLRDVAFLDTSFTVSKNGTTILECSQGILDGNGTGLLFVFLDGDGNIQGNFIGSRDSSFVLPRRSVSSARELLALFANSINSSTDVVKVLVVENGKFLTEEVKNMAFEQNIYLVAKEKK